MSRRTSRSLGCFLIAVALPILLFVGLAAIFVHNNRPPKITIPARKMPKDNGWDYFVKAGEMIGRTKHFGPYSDPNRRPEQWTKQELEAFFVANKSALDVLRQGLDKPCVHPPWHLNSDYPPYVSLRELARTLAGEARYYQVVGELGRAADSHMDCIEFGVMVQQGAPMIGGLVGVAIESIGQARFPPVLVELGRDDLEHVAERLERIQAKRVPYNEILLSESDATVAGTVSVFQDSSNIKDMANPKKWLEQDWAWTESDSAAAILWGNACFAFANKTSSLRDVQVYYKALSAEQLGPYTGKSNVPMPRGAMTRVLIPDVSKARATFTYRETMLALLQTEVALRRYRFDHGRYPDKLDALVPKYLKSAPIDPFGLGKPLRYRPLKDGREFLLYSLGPNLKDDGGVHGKWEGPDSKGDIVGGES